MSGEWVGNYYFDHDLWLEWYLKQTEPLAHKLSDHLMNPCTLTCDRCGMTVLDFHAVSYGVGLPCVS